MLFQGKYDSGTEFIKLSENDIIIHGITHYPLGSHKFIFYFRKYKDRIYIDVNTDFRRTEHGLYECTVFYNRHLCNNMEELRQMTFDAVERQAYNAYMDGAR